MTYPVVDLSNCDKEPIHILGKVQSYGFLVAADKNSFDILYASENLEQFTGIAYTTILAQNLSSFLEQLDDHDTENDLFSVVKFTPFIRIIAIPMTMSIIPNAFIKMV